jgi:hypothetical protein
MALSISCFIALRSYPLHTWGIICVASDNFKSIVFIYASDVLNKILSASVDFASWFQKFIISVVIASA